MAGQLAKELIGAGIHFGHRASRWNPKMKPYIFGRRNLIHIINIKETLRGILLARKFLSQVVSQGKDVLLVGTKRQSRKTVEDIGRRLGMHWVTDRWLGGTLTNFREIRKRVGRLDELERLETEGLMDTYSKKEGSSLRREMRKIRRNLEGIRRMQSIPGAMLVIDQRREIIAIREAKKVGVPVICLLDTDGDPDLVDIPIPGNDDAMRGIELVLNQLAEAVEQGLGIRTKAAETEEAGAQRRRSRRTTTARADKTGEQGGEAQPEADAPGAASADAPTQQPPAEGTAS